MVLPNVRSYLYPLLLLCCIVVFTPSNGQHTIERLPYPINTQKYDEICPIFSVNESLLFYTKVGHPGFNKTLIYNGEDLSITEDKERFIQSLKRIFTLISGTPVEDPITSPFNQDIWVANMEGTTVQIFHPGYPLNNALPNSICSVYGKEGYILVNQFHEEGGMNEGFSTITMDDQFNASFPKPFTIRDFDRISSDVNLSMSHDKQIVILSLANPYRGDRDLYVSIKFNDTLYASPIPLDQINTPYNETTPFISQDKTRIYFASDRPGGQGGLDLYYAYRQDYTYKHWDSIKTYNGFLNTTADESHPFVTKDQKKIYFTSNKKGSSDIFTAQLIRDPIHTPIVVKVNVIRGDTKKNFPAEINWRKTFKDEDWPNFWRTSNGYLEITFDANEPVDIKAENRKYRSEIVTLDPQELQDQGIKEYYLELIMYKEGEGPPPDDTKEEEVAPALSIKLEEGSATVLNNIYFQRSKSDVVPESFETLKSLATLLKTKPTLIIEVAGHTDNIGDKSALLNLSLQRAEAIKTFIVGQGVPEYQVETTGYGGTKPISPNDTEAHRRRNRRVEIKVLKM